MSSPWNAPRSLPGQPPMPPPQPAPGTIPLGTQPPRPVSIDAYSPPPSKVTPAIVLVVAAVSLIVGVFGYRLATTAGPSASASPTPSRTAAPSATRSGGVFFEARTDSASGYWSITSSRWEGNKLTVSVSVTVDQGKTKPSFYIFSNSDSKVYDAELNAPAPAFGSPTVNPGQTVSGNVVFLMTRGPGTLVLTDSAGRQISALPIKG